MAPVRTIRNVLMELRKVCQHPYLSTPELEDLDASDQQQQKALIEASGKLSFLKLLLPKLKDRGHRVLLFSQFKIALDRIEDFLIGEGYKFLRLDGDTPQAQRQKSMDAFNAPDSEFFIFLLTTRAGGVGINLASADTVIVYDPDFNPHQDLQAIARSYRYGQTKKVLVFKLMMKNSVEERIILKGKQKMVLDHLVVQQMDKENEEGDIDNMLLHGASALYDKTNEDGTSASDIRYTSKSVDELIDKVEADAEAEAEAMEERDKKKAEAPEEADVEGGVVKPKETMSFAFAKIWEAGKDRLKDLSDDEDEEKAEEDANAWNQVMENVQKAREAAELLEMGSRKRAREAAARATKMGFKAQPIFSDEGSDRDKKKFKIKGKRKRQDVSDAEFALNPEETESEDEGAAAAIPDAYDLVDKEAVPRLRGLAQAPHSNEKGLSAEDTAKLKLVQDQAQAVIRSVNDGNTISTVLGPNTDMNAMNLAKKRDKALAKEKRRKELIENAQNATIAVPGRPPMPLHLSSGSVTTKARPLINAARTQAAQHVLQWLYHVLSNLGLRAELEKWAIMALPELPGAKRRILYDELSRIADDEMYRRGQHHYFSLPATTATVSGLLASGGDVIPDDSAIPTAAVPPRPETLGVPRNNLATPHPQPKTHQTPTQPISTVPAASAHTHAVKQCDRHLPSPYASPRPGAMGLKAEHIAAPAQASQQAPSAPMKNVLNAQAGPSQPDKSLVTFAEPVSDGSCIFCGKGDHTLLSCPDLPHREALKQRRIEIQKSHESATSKADAIAWIDAIERLFAEEAQRAIANRTVRPPSVSGPTPHRPAAQTRTSAFSGTKDDAIVIDDDDDGAEDENPPSAKRHKGTPSKGKAWAGCPVCGSSTMHSIASCPHVIAGPESIKRAMKSFEPNEPIWKMLQGLYNKASTSAPSKSTKKQCAFCGETCGRTIRECAETISGGSVAGRKALKGKIRQLEKEGDKALLDELFDVYLQWPR